MTYTINNQSGSYTPIISDNSAFIIINSTNASTLNIPTNASVSFAIGTSITIIQSNTGAVTISAVTPGTTNVYSIGATASAPILRAQYSSATIVKSATDTWYVVGDIK